MKKICVYTALTGNYDRLPEIKNKEKNIDYLCFTNNKNLKSKTWRIILVDNGDLDNHTLSRKIKMLGHPIIDKNYDISLYMDANVEWTKSITEFVNTYLKNKPFASFRHSSRNCIYEETKECMRLRKDSKEKIKKTVGFLEKENFPHDLGLYEMTVFIKKHNDKTVKETMNLWYEMINNYSKRDQLSFMYSAWKTNLDIDPIDLKVWDNPWFHANIHTVNNEINKARIYFGDDYKDYNFDYDIDVDYTVEDNTYSMKTRVLRDTNEIKIELTKGIIFQYKKLKIKGVKYDSIEYHNSTTLFKTKKSYFYERGYIILKGDFKANEYITLSINLYLLSEEEKNTVLLELLFKNKDLNGQIDILQAHSDKILNSKSWKITKPLRFLIKLITGKEE